MKKVTLVGLFLMLSTLVFGANPFDELKNNLVQAPLDSLAKDLGSVIGGGTYRSGKTLGFPGLDISARAVSKPITSGNIIVKESGTDSIMWPAAQVEIGLPMNLDIIARYMMIPDATMTGFGLRSCLYKSTLPGIPSLSIQGIVNSLNCTLTGNKFSASVLSSSAMLSFNIPVVDPYIGVGIDQTELKPEATNLKGTASGTRVDAGVNLSLLPFTYLQVGIGMVNTEIVYNASFGLKI